MANTALLRISKGYILKPWDIQIATFLYADHKMRERASRSLSNKRENVAPKQHPAWIHVETGRFNVQINARIAIQQTRT